ncbi:hypothetical protein [Sphingomonas sp.]|uniref:hypothetical protein n=1 Tax=Sphingomonas sp. TaxID=28214 RepID=UPI0025D0E778|nr:hypothetical protein [Sphingomonas sp.]MBV9529343.1 hypothetical protein [Sphingomonas sp.]
MPAPSASAKNSQGSSDPPAAEPGVGGELVCGSGVKAGAVAAGGATAGAAAGGAVRSGVKAGTAVPFVEEAAGALAVLAALAVDRAGTSMRGAGATVRAELVDVGTFGEGDGVAGRAGLSAGRVTVPPRLKF